MKTIETKVYTFDELSDEAKEKARAWYRENDFLGQDAYDCTVEDAEQAGLSVDSIDDHKPNSGSFTDDAITCAQSIIENHGKDCETYKTAKQFLANMQTLEGLKGTHSDFDAAVENLESEFLYSLLEDYRIMFNKEYEYKISDEAVDENILANEYTFTETGKRFG